MNRRRLVAILAAAVAAIAIAGASFASPPRTYITHLTGSEEVPARETAAKGVAVFEVAPDGESIRYQLVSTRIDNAFMAHIHAGAFGTNGGIVVWLWPSTTPGAPGPLGSGSHNGLMTTGTITAADLVGSLAGQDLDALISLLASGGAYVNVHTNDGVAPTNTGPGDFPGGEIRGQID
ncbi:MAG TPA: CHRD domain-containing protein [Candidatus Limnocylindria bacterium]|nr:CHRD domain-containing protein [Candidatus Limnocylindria bacterium]